jgi:hypothetical protein
MSWFDIEGIDVGHASGHEEIDDALSLARISRVGGDNGSIQGRKERDP